MWRSVQRFLSAIEWNLGLWCLKQMNVGPDALRYATARAEDRNQISADDLDRVVNERVYVSLWQEWYGRERDFFRQCSQAVNTLEWEDVLKIGGPDIGAHADILREDVARAIGSRRLSNLRAGSFTIVSVGPSAHRIRSERADEIIEVPSWILGQLHHFDGQPTERALASVAASCGQELEDELLFRLVDRGVLVSPGDRRPYLDGAGDVGDGHGARERNSTPLTP